MPAPSPRPLRRAPRRTSRTHGTSRRARLVRVVAGLALATGPVGVVAPPADAVSPACDGSNGVTVTSLNAPHFYIDSGVSPALTSGYAGYDVSPGATRRDLWVRLSSFTGGALALGASQPSSMPLGPTSASSHTPAFFLLDATGQSTTAQNHVVQVWSGPPTQAGSTVLCTTTGGFGGVDETIKAAANKVQDTTGDGAAVTLSTSAPRLGGSVSVSVEGVTGTIGSGTSADPNGLYMTPTALPSWPAGAFRLTSTSLVISPDGTAPTRTYSNLLHLAPLGSSSRPYVATYTFTVTGTTSTGSQLTPLQQIASGTQIKHTDTGSFSTLIPAIPAATNPLTVALSASPTTLPAAGGVSHVSLQLRSTASTTSIADLLQVRLPAGASYVAGSSTVGGAAIPDPSSSGGLLSWTGPFSTSSSAPADLHVDVSLPPGAATYSLSGSGLLGSTLLDTTADTGDASPAPLTLTVPATDVQSQTITFPAPADTTLGDPAPSLGATASSGLPVTYDASTPSVCTVTSGGALTLLAAGTCTVTASQAGDASWAAATPVSRSFVVRSAPTSPAAQSLTFPPLADTTLGDPAPDLSATASSGLPVGYTTSTPDVCSVGDGTLTLLATGTCTVTASQAGDASWSPATPVDRSFVVLPAPAAPTPQTISFPTPPDAELGITPAPLAATASSQLTVVFSSTTPAVCTVVQDRVTLVAPGTCSVTASQPGDATYSAATPVTRSFAVAQAEQVITFPALPDTTLGQPAPLLGATASSALPVAYDVLTRAVCSVTGTTLVLAATGTCTVRALQPGDATYAPAIPASRSFLVTAAPSTPAPQTITFPTPTDTVLGRPAPTLGATASSGLPVTYASTTPWACTVDAGGTLSLTAVGTCSVVASQPGNASYGPATPVDRSFAVLAVPQTITFPQPPDVELGAAPTTLGATATSHLPVDYVSTTPTVCAVSDGRTASLAAGTCSVTARQPGNATYAPAPSVTRTFTVTAPATPPYRSSGVGTAVQSASVTVPSGFSITLLDRDRPVDHLVVAGQGTYTLVPASGTTPTTARALTRAITRALTVAPAATGATLRRIEFAPVLGFVGVAGPVTYRITGPSGQTAAATYTPTVTVPPAPPAPPRTTQSPDRSTQSTTVTVPPGGRVMLLDRGTPVTSLTIPGEGTYTVDPATGRLTFTPVAGFTGTASPVGYRVTDAYGQSTESTYRATVLTAPAPASPAPVRRPAPPAGRLPHTGLDVGLPLALAAGLLLLGSATTWAARRRR